MPSTARAYFDLIMGQSDRYAFLQSLTTTPGNFESESLDYKGNPQPNEVLKIWSEAVSGFANTGGGVVVWGLDCRDRNRVDAVCGLSLIDNPLVFKSQLLGNIHQTTNPPVQGIEIEIVDQGNGGPGFVVCLIPEGGSKPHRAEQAKNKPYLIRTGSSFVIPPPSLLRSMFFPVSNPDFEIGIQPQWGANSIEGNAQKSHLMVRLVATIKNVGSASADSLYVVCKSSSRTTWQSTLAWPGGGMNDGSFAASMQNLLHPGMESVFVHVKAELKYRFSGGRENPIPDENVSLEFDVYARDMVPKKYELQFTAIELQDRIQKCAARTAD